MKACAPLPRSWQWPCNENTKGLLRQYFPKVSYLSIFDGEGRQCVQDELNNRPRKTLHGLSPAEAFELLR